MKPRGESHSQWLQGELRAKRGDLADEGGLT